MEYISKKIPKESDGVLKYVQAHYQLQKGEKVTESEVIDYALRHVAQEQFGYREKSSKKYKLEDIIGLSKSKVRSTAKEIDKIVYGV